jgi:hypothetical protein
VARARERGERHQMSWMHTPTNVLGAQEGLCTEHIILIIITQAGLTDFPINTAAATRERGERDSFYVSHCSLSLIFSARPFLAFLFSPLRQLS